ncbi:MAG: lipoate--protein ligase family protein [Cyanobacteriota bacterium]|nr:lipoate--protein ligase family protein [Cyanobacteriota bacterium]
MAEAPASPMAAGLLDETVLSGVWQMALDGALLERRQPLLRLYRWRRPTLSLGFHQPLQPAWLQWQQQGHGDLVRRPSGGGAVLHGGDLCYALIWPEPPLSRLGAYTTICAWLQRAFADLGEPLRFGREAAALGVDCFARSTAADLVTDAGVKRIGSAQRWQRGCLLQHGSIQLAPDPQHWAMLLGTPAPQLAPLPLSGAALSNHLIEAARPWLQLPAQPRPLEAALLAQAGQKIDHYSVEGGGSAVTSPLATIAPTT